MSSITTMPGSTATRTWLNPLLGHKINAVIRGGQTVGAGNDCLARHARQAGARDVEIVPTAIDLSRYSTAPEAPPGKALTVGWIGIRSTRTTSR